MHHSGPLSLTFEGAEQGFGGKNCQKCESGKTLYPHIQNKADWDQLKQSMTHN